jgi:hypothetical protein
MAPVYTEKMQIGLSFAPFFDFVLPRNQGSKLSGRGSFRD